MLDKKRLGPVRDQGQSGICYAFTAADLLTYKTRRPVSAPGVAAIYYIAKKSSLKNHADGGIVGQALRLAGAKGACLESEMSSKNPNLVFDAVTEMVEQKHFACEDVKETLKEVFPRAGIEDLLKATSQYTDHYNKAMAALIINACKNPLYFQGKVNEIYYTKRTNLFLDTIYSYKNSYNPLKEIDAQLNRNNLVALSISDFKKFARVEGEGHSVSVVGRKKDPRTNKCMYQIRNSWGQSCRTYHKRFQATCKDGYFWVNGDDLYNPKTYELNVRRVTYLDK